MEIGLLVIATKKYIQFVAPLWESTKKYFMAGTPHKVHMFVFTDSPTVPEGTILIPQEHQKWPFSTLCRYHMFTRHKEQLSKMDYLFYSDADMRFEGNVGEEILGELVATQHPGFYDKPYSFFSQSYEKRPQSKCYMPPGYGKAYYAGGFNGGRATRFLQMAEELKEWIDTDLKNGIIPIWNDESAANRYWAEHPPTVVLNPAYCYQEERVMPFERKLVALLKNHAELRL